MKLEGQKTIAAPIERTWAALNDPAILQASIAGCESLELTGENEYAAALKLRIGPVNARFKGRLKLSDIVAPNSYRIAFEGQGGAAGFGKGTADVRLEPDGENATLLSYVAEAQVGGKIAQIGSRLIDAAAAKVAGDFFDAFEARLATYGPPATEAAATTTATETSTRDPATTAKAPEATDSPAPAEGTETAERTGAPSASGSAAPPPPPVTTAAPARSGGEPRAAVPPPPPARTSPSPEKGPGSRSRVLWWAVVTAVIVIIVYALRK